MMTSVTLAVADSQFEIIPQEGAVLAQIQSRQNKFLAETPWAHTVSPSIKPAADEPSWVKNWRGGWQLCAPNTGSFADGTPDAAFHGAASQANWRITEQTSNSLSLNWTDEAGAIELTRRWSFSENGIVTAETSATNHSSELRAVGFAEHLILGSDFLQPVQHGSAVNLNFCPAATIVDLDYSGAPTKSAGQGLTAASHFTRLTAQQPAKVFALAHPESKVISIEVGDLVARVEWQGLEHALVWQEFGTSKESPWNGQVFALGIEPTNVAHGLGANEEDGPFLSPGETISWRTSLQFFRKVDDSLEPAA
jgi:galactose mutarotase-like enzyme